MSWRLDSRRRLVLLGLAVAALLLQALLEHTRAPVRQRDYDLKLDASRRAAAAFAALRAHRGLEDGTIDLVNDPAGTGLVGPEFSLITNSRGELEAKLTSLNPNFAGLLVQYCRQAGLRPGDPVAVAVSGSFPGLNIGLYAALEAMGVEPVVITSVGASMWGANDPDFTWLDMEALLAARGIFRTRSAAATHGGGNDMGRGLSPEGRRLIEAAAERNGVPMLASANIEDAIARRMAFYDEAAGGRAYKLFVNVGGGVASIGSSHNRLLLPAGLSFDLGEHNWARKGSLVLFAERGVPVIHLLNLTGLAREHAMPVAPDYQPLPGEGEIFEREMYSLPLAAVSLVLYCLVCLLVLAPEVRSGLFDRLTRRSAVRAALLAAALAGAAGGAEAATSWRSAQPSAAADLVCIESDGQRLEYARIDGARAAVFEITGPRRCKLITRSLGGEPWEITVTVDGAVNQARRHRCEPSSRTAACADGAPASELRRAYFDVGPGKHTVEVTGSAADGAALVCRLFGETRTRGSGLVPLTPASYAAVATLQFESGSQSTYYLAADDRAVALEVTGPTVLHVFTRLDFDQTMSGAQPYALEVVRDGADGRVHHLTAEKLSSALWLERPGVMPGTRQRIRITVPEGRHHYELRCLRPTTCGMAVQVQIPRGDLETGP